MADATDKKEPVSPPAPPCTLVIFGAAGDLTKRLLMPALYNLAGGGLLDPNFSVLGVDHNRLTDEGWRQDLSDTMASFSPSRGSNRPPLASKAAANKMASSKPR